jgi:polysaccharide pyruvyl transferase WcaK-like protein
MLGASDRVEKVLGSADIFVGVSRAALEAMASECAVILAGNEGYLSVFSPRCASMAAPSNFCCRGGAAADATLLTQDLASLLALPKEALRAMGRANRAYVEEKYSARRMALDAIGAYEGVLKRKAILCGYYGFENVGDTLMHRSLTERLRGMGYQRIYTLSSKLFSLSSLYAVGEGYDFFLGGGNLLQSESSMRSLYFYTALMRFAAWRGGRVFMLSSGLGGFRATGEALASHCLTLCEHIECRTEGDLSEAMRLGAKNAVLSHDAVLDLPLGIQKNGASRILLAFRSPKTHASRLSLSSFILRLGKLYGKERLTLFAMHPADARFVKRTARRLHISYAVGDADFFVSLLSECMAVYGNRLHAAVCAVRMGVPAFLLEEDEKSRRFAYDAREAAKSLSLPSPVKLFSLSADIPHGDGISRLGILRVCDKMRTDAEDVR